MIWLSPGWECQETGQLSAGMACESSLDEQLCLLQLWHGDTSQCQRYHAVSFPFHDKVMMIPMWKYCTTQMPKEHLESIAKVPHRLGAALANWESWDGRDRRERKGCWGMGSVCNLHKCTMDIACATKCKPFLAFFRVNSCSFLPQQTLPFALQNARQTSLKTLKFFWFDGLTKTDPNLHVVFGLRIIRNYEHHPH